MIKHHVNNNNNNKCRSQCTQRKQRNSVASRLFHPSLSLSITIHKSVTPANQTVPTQTRSVFQRTTSKYNQFPSRTSQSSHLPKRRILKIFESGGITSPLAHGFRCKACSSTSSETPPHSIYSLCFSVLFIPQSDQGPFGRD